LLLRSLRALSSFLCSSSCSRAHILSPRMKREHAGARSRENKRIKRSFPERKKRTRDRYFAFSNDYASRGEQFEYTVRIPRVESCEGERGAEARSVQGSLVQAGVIFRKLPRRKPDLRSLWPCAFAKSYLHSFSGSRLSRKHSTRLLSLARSSAPRFYSFYSFRRLSSYSERRGKSASVREKEERNRGREDNRAKKEQGGTGGEKEAGGGRELVLRSWPRKSVVVWLNAGCLSLIKISRNSFSPRHRNENSLLPSCSILPSSFLNLSLSLSLSLSLFVALSVEFLIFNYAPCF